MKRWILPGLALLMVCVGVIRTQAEGEGKPRPKHYTGELGKVEGNTFTVNQKGEGGPRSETFIFRGDTRVRLETTEDEKVKVKGDGGEHEVTRPRVIDGKLSDLKSGQRLTVTYTADKEAVDVLAHRKPTKGKAR